MRIKVGVMGSAGETHDPGEAAGLREKAERLLERCLEALGG